MGNQLKRSTFRDIVLANTTRSANVIGLIGMSIYVGVMRLSAQFTSNSTYHSLSGVGGLLVFMLSMEYLYHQWENENNENNKYKKKMRK